MNYLMALLHLLSLVHISHAVIAVATCGGVKGCILFPSGCSGTACIAALTWTPSTPGYMTLELAGQAQYSYVSACFSTDNKMGDDDCIDCMKTSPMTIQNSYNTGYYNDATGSLIGLNLTSTQNANGQFSCVLERQVTVPGQTRVVELSRLHHILLAVGPMDSGVKSHHTNKMSSLSKVNMTEIGTVAGGSAGPSKLVKAHGALMTAAWLLCATLGMFIARYMKAGWAGKKLMGLPYWFFLHRLLMVTAVLLSSVGFALIFIHVKGYSNMSTQFFESHPPIGIAVMTLALINPIMSAFRCDGGNSKRWIFNWAHYLVGNIALMLAFVNVYSGYDLIQEQKAQWIVVGYGGVYVFMSLFMEIHRYCILKDINKSNSIEMTSSDEPKVKPKKSSSNVKHVMFMIFALVSIGVLVALLLIILL